MSVGPLTHMALAFVADGAVTQHRVAVQGANDGEAKLPAADDASGILGVFTESRTDEQAATVTMDGSIEFVEAGGACTRGLKARVLNTGTVENVATNATPAEQTYLGQFMESATVGQLVRVLIRPGQITQ